MDIEKIKQLLNASKINWSTHCLERIQERDISIADIKKCIMSGEVIEDYPNTSKFMEDLRTRRAR